MRLIALVILLAPALAEAYPQFQLSLGVNRCETCHLSPAGGGLINDYGRDEAGTTISRGGDGAFLHGVWDPPDWFALGGDFRFAAADRYVAEINDVAIFPMQADVNLRAMTSRFAFAFTAGVRGQSRDPEMRQAPVLIERLTSREHYVAYTRADQQLRVGRFFPVFGLRLPDHTAYVRRFMGFNLQEESYGLELAHYGAQNVVHVTGFMPPPLALLGSGQRPSGIAAHWERDVSDNFIAGAQARYATSAEETRYTAGALGKLWMPDAGLMWLAELDLQRQTFDAVAAGRNQVAAYLGASKFVTRGVLVGGAVHGWDPDVALRASARYAFEATVQYFPRAHFEVVWLNRLAASGDVDAQSRGFVTLIQLHYYP